MGLRALQQYIQDGIAKHSTHDFRMGPLIIVSQSAIYTTTENADKLIQRQYTKICQQRDYADPSGNFTISVQEWQDCCRTYNTWVWRS